MSTAIIPVLSLPLQATTRTVELAGAPHTTKRPPESAVAVSRCGSSLSPRLRITHSGHSSASDAPATGDSSRAERTTPWRSPKSASRCGPQRAVISVAADGTARVRATSPASRTSMRTSGGSSPNESSTGCRKVASQVPAGTLSCTKPPSLPVVAVRPVVRSVERTSRTVAPASGRVPMLSKTTPVRRARAATGVTASCAEAGIPRAATSAMTLAHAAMNSDRTSASNPHVNHERLCPQVVSIASVRLSAPTQHSPDPLKMGEPEIPPDGAKFSRPPRLVSETPCSYSVTNVPRHCACRS